MIGGPENSDEYVPQCNKVSWRVLSKELDNRLTVLNMVCRQNVDRQNVDGQNVEGNVEQTRCRTNKMSTDKMSTDKMLNRQNVDRKENSLADWIYPWTIFFLFLKSGQINFQIFSF